jgi:hypothetical protein
MYGNIAFILCAALNGDRDERGAAERQVEFLLAGERLD